jgi:acyl carrier protein
MTDRIEVLGKVEEVLVDALGVDEDEVTEDATLMGDLGAESIDLLDIVFRLEKSFDIKIPKGELFPDDMINNQDYVDNGKITAAGMVRLKGSMPHLDLKDFEHDPEVSRIFDLFTVGTIVNYVERKLNGQLA